MGGTEAGTSLSEHLHAALGDRRSWASPEYEVSLTLLLNVMTRLQDDINARHP